MSSRTASISSSPLPLSRIGLGCVTFGREIDEAAAFCLLDHAYASGVTSFDTASAYSQGASERILGSWIASRKPSPGSYTVATKILPPYEPALVKEALDRSLERLGLPAVDLLYLHRWDGSADRPDALAALHDLATTGKVRALGVSNYTQEQLAAVVALQRQLGLQPFRAIQNNHNFAIREAPLELRNWCAAEDIVVITYSPLGAGFLTGKHKTGVQPGSRFALVPGHQEVYFHTTAYERLAYLEALAVRTGHSQAHLALAWALHQPGTASVLIGGRTPAHLDQALAALHVDVAGLFAD